MSHRTSASFGGKAADWIAGLVGSWKFIIVQAILLVAWMAANVLALVTHWDPYPFILLNLVLSFQAAFTAPIIMISQNRQEQRDKAREELDRVRDEATARTVQAIEDLMEGQVCQTRAFGPALERIEAKLSHDPKGQLS